MKGAPDTQVELIDGQKGEPTVLVGGREVAGKKGDSPPTVDEDKAAVAGATSGAR